MDFLYHGSCFSGFTELKACSKLHYLGKNVVYLTDNIPYALTYIWDSDHNVYSEKHITCWIKDGIAFYEEQFPEQLKTFYKGVSGYLYYIFKNSNIRNINNRESLYYSLENMAVTKVVHVSDVYEELLKYETLGKFKVLRYNEQSRKRQEELIDLIASYIIKGNFFKCDDAQAMFIKKHFVKAWEKAKSSKNS